jgi:hypothetical protein
MGNATSSADEQALATVVSQILVSPPCQRISFCFGDTYVDGAGYYFVALSLASIDNKAKALGVVINTKLPAGTEAQYDPTSNNLVLPRPGYGGTGFQKMSILHELTHAVLDSRAPRQIRKMLDNETTAYLAGALYNVFSAPSATGPFGYQPGPGNPIYVEAHRLAMAARRHLEQWSNSFRYLFNPWDVVTLQNAITASPTYAFIKADPAGHYGDDGLPL